MNLKLILASLLLTGTCFAAAPTATEISAWQIPGECKGQPANQQCAKYAFLLNLTLAEHGIESKALAYHMSGSEVTHAIVLFKIGSQSYIIDNESDTAVKVSGKTELAMVRKFDKNAIKIQTIPFYKDSSRYLLELGNVVAK